MIQSTSVSCQEAQSASLGVVQVVVMLRGIVLRKTAMGNLQRLVLHVHKGPTENRRESQRMTENFEFPRDIARRRGVEKTTPKRPQTTPRDPCLFVRSGTLENFKL